MRNAATGTTLTALGSVLTKNTTIPLFTRVGATTVQQDNFVSVIRPIDVKLNDLGLITSGAFLSSPSAVNRIDQLFVFDNTVAATNKSPSATYFYFNGAWRKFGQPLTTDFGNDTIATGSGFVIRKGGTATGHIPLEELTDLLTFFLPYPPELPPPPELFMKRICLVGLSLLASVAFAHGTVLINLGAGNIYGTSLATLAPPGSLLQLIVSTTDNIFTAPVAGSYTGGSADDIVLASFVINAGLGSPGTVAQPITITYTGNITAGDLIMLRWFPTLTPLDTAPPADAPFGQFRIDLIQDFSTIAWVLPPDVGGAFDLNFLTMAQGSTVNPETAGLANMVVAIPERSTVALLGLSVISLAAYSRRRKVKGWLGPAGQDAAVLNHRAGAIWKSPLLVATFGRALIIAMQ